jgi:hypothetical protein
MISRTRRYAARRQHRRRGIALVAVVLALLGISVLLSTVFAMTAPMHRTERIKWAALRAQLGAAASLAENDLRAPWPWMEAGDTAARDVTPAVDTRVRAQRLALHLPFVAWRLTARATGQGSTGTAGTELLVLGRRTVAHRLPAAALLATATVQLDSGVIISGAPVANPPWSTCAQEQRAAAVRLADSSQLAGAAHAIIVGTPAYGASLDIAVVDSITQAINALNAGRTLTLTADSLAGEPIALHGVCTPSSTNLGEPRRTLGAVDPCRGYAPVAHVTPAWGTVVVYRPSRAQGAVLVEGNLELRAPLEITGLLLVRGSLDASMAPLLINGTVVALGPAHLSRGSRLAYAECAAIGAQLSAAPIRPVSPGGAMPP